ncbi:DNA-processing protein DprA [Agrilactobacillus yilanensis]|uniref:DNA-processing protein DprA n=1 Tax=Agrilactobacillus yilanensis TaxID=2485997 RepID=A0ABW4J7C1_9LACO|nr:DNA-processing protein DprA [Agrilactobacillus yilanensis]
MFTDYLLKLKLSQVFTNQQLLRVAQYLQTEEKQPTLATLLAVTQVKPEKRYRVHEMLRASDLDQKVAFNKQHTKTLTILDDQYPLRLREIYNPPALLFYRGDLAILQQTCLGIVGARNCTNYAEIAINRILMNIQDIAVVSGLAMGVDRIAHQVALQSSLKTVAVIGSGLDQVYPKQNRSLQQQISTDGLLITEYPLGVTPRPYHFPQRNRIIAGFVHGLLVVEAKERSGSLITASLALENNRQIFAIPGSIFSPLSKGANQLIQAGATPVEKATDILNELTYFE